MSTILVVDDDPQIREWLRHILENRGYQVEEVGDGKEALAFLERAKPALMVLDLFMPNMDGAELLWHLRSRSQSIRALAIYGQVWGGRDLTLTAIILGAHAALAKPFDAETFVNHVDALLFHPSCVTC